jgi:predicted RND superfamily exporter protein
MLQATLTLPGMAAMALALGMAIDSNVLINERVREELRSGASPQAAIHAGYERAWATILDSNISTLIAGLALLAFGSGPVRGFAVVHCIGILTSMFSAVFLARPGQPLVRPPEKAQVGFHRHRVAARRVRRRGDQVIPAFFPEFPKDPRWNSSKSGATFRSCGMP